MLAFLRGSEAKYTAYNEDRLAVVPVSGGAARILTEAGFRVVAAHDGSEALALLAAFEGQVQLVVSDIAMPGMTGVQLAQTVTTRWPALPLLLMSGQSPGPDYVGRFLPKPFTTDSLLETVAALVPAARH